MSIYDIVYKDICNDLYPTNKRMPIMLKKEYCFLNGIDFQQKLFGYFINGTNEPNYNDTTSYTFGQMVVYQRKVYLRNEIIKGYTVGSNPLTIYFTKVLDDFVGVGEKVYFGPSKIVMEYALNRIFQTTFRQPVGATPAHSDIYILNNQTSKFQFYIGDSDNESSYIVINDDVATSFITFADLDPSIRDFSVYVPIAVLTALNADITKAKAIILSVVNKYKLSGYTASIEQY